MPIFPSIDDYCFVFIGSTDSQREICPREAYIVYASGRQDIRLLPYKTFLCILTLMEILQITFPKAFDQQQQDLILAASKAVSYRQDIMEENVRLTYALQVPVSLFLFQYFVYIREFYILLDFHS